MTPISLLAAIFYAYSNIFFLIALRYTYTANVLVLYSTCSIWGYLFSYYLLNEPIVRHTAICCIVVILGVILIFLSEWFDEGIIVGGSANFYPTITENLIGMLLSLTVAISNGAYYTLLRLSKNTEGRTLDVTPILVVATTIVTTFSLFLNDNGITNGTSFMLTGNSQTIFIYLQGIIVLPVSFVLMSNASSYITSTEIGMILAFDTVLEPIWVELAGFEGMPEFTVVGGCIIVISLLVNNYITIQKSQIREYESIL